MPKRATSSKDLLLLLLYAKGAKREVAEPISGRTRLVKMLFLFDKELRRDFDLDKVVSDDAIPSFEAFNYGPFSGNIYADLEFLVGLNFVSVTPSDEDVPEEERLEYAHWDTSAERDEDEFTYDIFALTSIGKKFVELGRAGDLSPEQWRVLDTFKARCTSVPLRALLQYVYSKYPETTGKSKIRAQILPERP